MNTQSWFVYMVRCENGSLYTGCTNNLIRRWHQHCRGEGAKYLRSHSPMAVVYVEELPDRSRACRREYRIKQFSKAEKEALASNNESPRSVIRES